MKILDSDHCVALLRGELDAYQLPSGTIVVRDEAVDPAPEGVALYARVSSHDQKADAERPGVIVIEDLDVVGMLQNRRLARAVADVGMHEFQRQMDYKCRWYGVRLEQADRWYPSSKICSCCGTAKGELELSERLYRCEACGLVLDRDENAARNLAQIATASSAGSEACRRSP